MNLKSSKLELLSSKYLFRSVIFQMILIKLIKKFIFNNWDDFIKLEQNNCAI